MIKAPAKTPHEKGRKKSAPSKKVHSKALYPIMIAVFFTLAVLAIIAFGIMRVNKPSISTFLPQQETISLLEFENDTLPEKFEGQGWTLISSLQELTGLPLQTFPQEWWSHPFGVILIETKEGENVWALFAEGASRRKMAQDLSANASLQSQSGLYTHAQGFPFKLAPSSHHVFISSSPEVIETLQQVENNPLLALENAPLFQKSQSQMPGNAWLKGYLNPDKLNLPQYPATNYALSSMSHLADHARFSLQSDSRGLSIKNVVSLANASGENHVIENKNTFQDMARYAPADSVALFVSGPHLTQQWQATLMELSQLNPAYGVILESLVRAQVQELFGGNVNLRNDLYPLLEGPYAAFLGRGENGYSLGLVMQHDEKHFVEVKLDKLLNGFYALVGKLNPQIKVVVLPDGTESRELVSNTQSADETKEEYEGLTLTCLSTELSDFSTLQGELLRSFCYSTTPELFYLATSKSLLKEMVKAGNTGSLALSNAAPFKNSLGSWSRNADQLSYVNMDQLAPLLAKSQTRQKVEGSQEDHQTLFHPLSVLSALGQSTWVKQTFEGGLIFEGVMR